MLAKEIKIRNLKKQRNFIEKDLLKVMSLREDGDVVYYYRGHLFQEVKEYFENEGFNVERIDPPGKLASILGGGMPVYCFTLKDIELTEEELEQANAYEPENSEEEDAAEDAETEEGVDDVVDDAVDKADGEMDGLADALADTILGVMGL